MKKKSFLFFFLPLGSPIFLFVLNSCTQNSAQKTPAPHSEEKIIDSVEIQGLAKPASEMMDEETFWKLINEAKDAAGKEYDSLERVKAPLPNRSHNCVEPKYLAINLSQLSPKEIISFELRRRKLVTEACSFTMYCTTILLEDD